MSSVGESLTGVFDYVWERLTARVAGIEDAEYLWEPVEGAWSLRADPTGRMALDGAGRRDDEGQAHADDGEPGTEPFTTIAWRLGHICDPLLTGFARRMLALDDSSPVPVQPAEVAGLAAYMDGAYQLWRGWVARLDAPEWDRALGPDWGPYADDTNLDLALHVLDELAHHGAEVALMRDLYSRRAQLTLARPV